jgi:protocatechuate 3,4-dioxygenase beta subunit
MSLLSVVFILVIAIVDVPLTTGQNTSQATGEDQSGNNFYRSGAPMGQPPFMVCNNTPTDDRLFINVTVMSTLGMGIKNVEVEVWQAYPNGTYSQGNDWSCRTIIQTDDNGRFNFSTVMPGREVYSMGNYRPANIHFRVDAPNGYNQLITEAYFYGDMYLAPNDPCMSCSSNDPSLLIHLMPFNGDIKTWTGQWQIVLATESSSSINNIVGPIVNGIEHEASQVLKPIEKASSVLQHILRSPFGRR